MRVREIYPYSFFIRYISKCAFLMNGYANARHRTRLLLLLKTSKRVLHHKVGLISVPTGRFPGGVR